MAAEPAPEKGRPKRVLRVGSRGGWKAKTKIYTNDFDMLYDCGAGGSFIGTDSFVDLLKCNR